MIDDVSQVQQQSQNRDREAMRKLMEDAGVTDEAGNTTQVQVPKQDPPPTQVTPTQDLTEYTPPPSKVIPEEPKGDGPIPEKKVTEDLTLGTAPQAPPPAGDTPPVETDPLKIIEGIKLRPDASPRTAENFALVKKHAADAITELSTLKPKIQELETKLKETEGRVVTPELEQELERLRNFEATFGIEDHPEFNAEFDSRIKASESTATDMLQQWKIIHASSAKYIIDHGGVSQFRTSNEPMPPNFKNEDGSPMTHRQYWANYIQPVLDGDISKKETLDDVLRDVRQVQREREARIKEVKSNRDKFVQEATATQEKFNKDWNDRATNRAQEVIKSFGDLAQARQVPPTATPEEKAAIEKHNARIIKADTEAKRLASEIFKSPETYIETVMHAVRSQALDEILEEQKGTITTQADRIKALEAEIEAIKASATTVHKTVPVSQRPEVRKPPPNETAQQAMKRQMDEYASARR